MARGLNKVMLIGNLGADPEIKYSASGTAIANLRLATSDRRKNRDGDWEDVTEWHRVVMFGKQADTCKDYLKKGSKIYVEGRLQTRTWDDQNGQKHYATDVIANSFIFLEPRGQDTTSNTSAPRGPSSQFNASQPPPHNDVPEVDDDLPF